MLLSHEKGNAGSFRAFRAISWLTPVTKLFVALPEHSEEVLLLFGYEAGGIATKPT